MKSLRKYRAVVLFIVDILIIFSAYFVGSFLITNTKDFLTEQSINITTNTIIVSVITYMIIFNIFDVYKNITRYETGKDYLTYIFLCIFSCAITLIADLVLRLNVLGFKQIILSNIIITVAMIAYRVIIRFILSQGNNVPVDGAQGRKNLLIIGAGEAARDIIKTIKTSMRNTYNIVGLIDDNENKINYLISGVRILGDRYKILEVCKENNVNVIFFSITNISNIDKREIINICQETGAKIRILPSTADLIKNRKIIQNLRDVEIEDVLGRDQIILDNEDIAGIIQGRTVLVTGGGGSIGSELCRQVVTRNPEKLIIFDCYENNLYDIEMELRAKNLSTEIIAIVGSVRDIKKLEQVFNKYKPELVFHAAAHKHVPLMETSPLEAIKNNVFGTYNVVNCADKYKTKKFILISTDKAVNPTNIMGATKRICEMIVQAKNKVSKTEYLAVRFGNVLGSNGSVIPLFKKQIAAGGPVTVTHEEITRFFMTIPEAVGLILQATTYAKGGEIFVLDMGEPVKIYDLAVSLIRLSGYEPNKDIQIEVTGLRPGEKLYEELLMSEEGLKKTSHDKIFIGALQDISIAQLEEKINILKETVKDENIELEQIKETMKKIVPTYREPEEINNEIEEVKREKRRIKDSIGSKVPKETATVQ